MVEEDNCVLGCGPAYGLECEQPDEGREGWVVSCPACQETGGQPEALMCGEEGLVGSSQQMSGWMPGKKIRTSEFYTHPEEADRVI